MDDGSEVCLSKSYIVCPTECETGQKAAKVSDVPSRIPLASFLVVLNSEIVQPTMFKTGLKWLHSFSSGSQEHE